MATVSEESLTRLAEESGPPDCTVVYYTANAIPRHFAKHTRRQLLRSIGNLPLIVVSHKPLYFGDLSENIVVNLPRQHLSIYKQALIGAEAATTKYIALAEDDILYSPEHFSHRPTPGHFAYDISYWGVYTWTNPPVFSYKGRRNLWSLICERELFLEAMMERFMKFPNDEDVNPALFCEPGKYERQLGVTPRQTEVFWSNPPNIMFSHQTALSFSGLGKRKKHGDLQALEVPYWGRAEEIIQMYKGEET